MKMFLPHLCFLSTHLDTETHVNAEAFRVPDGQGDGVVGDDRAANVDVDLEVGPRPEIPTRELREWEQWGQRRRFWWTTGYSGRLWRADMRTTVRSRP